MILRIFLLPALLLLMPTISRSQAKADSYILINGDGVVLKKKNETEERYVASLTKVATALVVLSELQSDSSVKPQTEKIPVPAAALVGGANPLGLAAGDRITIHGALHAAILGSDNVSAYSLAEYFGGVPAFVMKMNELAKSLDMEQTNFINPHGLDFANSKGKSTALDMAKLGLAASENESFMEICSKATEKVAVDRGGREITKTVKNTNDILGKEGVDGMKTGTTRRSGACFLGSAVRDGKRYVCVVLNSPDRFADTLALLQSDVR